CGCAVGATQEEAFRKAYEGDPLSAFGGVISFNLPVDEATAMQLTEPGRFVECVIAPDFAPAAFEILTTRPTWKKNVRLCRTGRLWGRGGWAESRRGWTTGASTAACWCRIATCAARRTSSRRRW